DTSGVVRQLQYVNADYTILMFWEPTCSHCKKEIPVIKAYYDSLRAQGVAIEVYAINSEHDPVAWKKYIRDNKLTWVNVMSADPQLLANYKFYYDVYSTPTVYLLDKQKKIFAKRLDAKGIEGFMNRRIEDDKKKAKASNPK
ncbi:MAG: TlpA family protein disulfide reductase, partial [Bacteroidia bacterium]